MTQFVRVVLVAAAVPVCGAARAEDRVVPAPLNAPIAVLERAEAAEAELRAATARGEALAADLTLGQSGSLVASRSAQALEPGRYRLHALVASTPHDHVLTEAVGLKLTANGQAADFVRRWAFPEPGVLAPVFLDFVVAEAGPVDVAVSWHVDDSHLDMKRYRHASEARKAYLAQRQNAINQYVLALPSEGADVLGAQGDDEFAGLEEVFEKETPRLRERALDGKELSPYRLLLTGLLVERLTPVGIVSLETDAPAYEPGHTGRATVVLRNLARRPVDVALQWSVTDDDDPDRVLAKGEERISLRAGQKLAHTVGESFSTRDVSVVGRVTVEASAGELRANRGGVPFVVLPPPREPYPRDKRIFAHYMGCWPIGYGALPHERRTEGEHLKHENSDPKISRGGHVRNYPLAPPDLQLTPEESADLEIRRALRIGIDGFAIDAWAGGDGAMKVFDALIRTAETKAYPFEVTICLDPACGGDWIKTVRWLVGKYGDHPKLARRGGKPLVFGYSSRGQAFWFADWKLGAKTDSEKQAVRTSPLGWHLAGAGFRWAERNVGQPIFYHFDYGYLFHPYKAPAEKEVAALGTIARHVGAVGAFQFQGALGDEKAAAVKAAGAEWSGACGLYQKENIPFEYYIQPGTEFMEWKWGDVRRQDATLPQFTSWNDYGEGHHIAPAWQTRYALYDLTGYHIEWWKTGMQPTVDHDRVYLIYAKYPRGAEVWPFEEGARKPRKLEVLTILPEAATIRLPGRDIEFEAPAGYSRQQFPLAVGPVIAEVVRGGKVVNRIESPEPITDRPFRESNGMVCFSTEFERHWRADFGEAKPFLYGEYADDDGDGLPNWFEMYWFSEERDFEPVRSDDALDLLGEGPEQPVTRWLDFSTMTLVSPDADPNRDGKTNLESYLQRVDPTRPPHPQVDGM